MTPLSRRVAILLLFLSVVIVPSSGQNDANGTITVNNTIAPSVIGTMRPESNISASVPDRNETDTDGASGIVPDRNETDVNATASVPDREETDANATGIVPDREETTDVNASGIVPDREETNETMPSNIFDQGNDGTVEDDSGSTGNATRPPTVDANATTPPPVTDCTNSEECGPGRFCSSSTNVCEQLSCSNWQLGLPEGEIAYGEGPCIQEGAEEGTSFCGWDGSCYSYNCENWYKFGPVEFTGYDVNNPVDLSCEEYGDGAVENQNSIVFGCRPYQPGSKAPEALTWTHFFNQKCTSTPRGSDAFTCYQNQFGTNYNDFLGEVSRLNQNSCDREIYENEQPLYWYIIMMQQIRQEGEPINYKQGRPNTLSGFSFDASEADRTMYAQLISPDAAPEQPVLDGAGGNDDSSAISCWSGLASLMMSLLAGTFFL